ncbi:hypothetical protein C8R45DRAFT_510191 [Mycena sanguinolenta]|nr:hypothetical protein C8R45DRAFT_510191 [Mycena sanguinolenta]
MQAYAVISTAKPISMCCLRRSAQRAKHVCAASRVEKTRSRVRCGEHCRLSMTACAVCASALPTPQSRARSSPPEKSHGDAHRYETARQPASVAPRCGVRSPSQREMCRYGANARGTRTASGEGRAVRRCGTARRCAAPAQLRAAYVRSPRVHGERRHHAALARPLEWIGRFGPAHRHEGPPHIAGFCARGEGRGERALKSADFELRTASRTKKDSKQVGRTVSGVRRDLSGLTDEGCGE